MSDMCSNVTHLRSFSSCMKTTPIANVPGQWTQPLVQHVSLQTEINKQNKTSFSVVLTVQYGTLYMFLVFCFIYEYVREQMATTQTLFPLDV